MVRLRFLFAATLGLAACSQPRVSYRFETSLSQSTPDGSYTTVGNALPAAHAAAELLPEGKEVCRSFGLDPDSSKACSVPAVLHISARQTDPSRWYGGTVSRVGEPPDGCPGARAFARYPTANGASATTYLCRADTRDDTITDGELNAFEAAVKKLNAAEPKTANQFGAAKDFKFVIRAYAMPEVERR